MLNITLTDQADRKRLATMNDAELFDAATQAWVLNPVRARRERYVAVVANHAYVMIIEIADLELAEKAPADSRKDDRYKIVGKPLRSDHPIVKAMVGTEAVQTRNPIRYRDSEFDLSECLCGCGTVVKSDFAPGHDQRAIHARVGKFGSVAHFVRWFDDTYQAA